MSDTPKNLPMSRSEFVALIAMLFATIALSIDAMLPALPEMGKTLAPDTPERAGLILTSFVLGMGLGTFITGPLSDTFGRRRIVFLGAGLYILCAGIAAASQSLEVMLIARLVQGLGAAGPRIVALAIVRDLFSGRQMAQIISIVMMIFTLVPAIAPTMGAMIIATSNWRGIFVAFMVFSAISTLWLALRLPETLPPEERRPLRLSSMWAAVVEMFSHPTVRLSIYVQTLAMAMLFVLLMLVQPIYADVYGRAESFPYWFGAVAVLAGTASLLNALLVVRLGMQRLVRWTLAIQILLSGLFVAFDLGASSYGFAFFVIWQTCLFAQAGLTLGNLNAIAMEPMGHIAGMAASVIGAVSTVLAAVIASPVGIMFDGTTRPLSLSVFVMAVLGFGMMLRMKKVSGAD
ncbi:MAG: multidrug effflux MFS transporter [Sulfitobacter sp.]